MVSTVDKQFKTIRKVQLKLNIKGLGTFILLLHGKDLTAISIFVKRCQIITNELINTINRENEQKYQISTTKTNSCFSSSNIINL